MQITLYQNFSKRINSTKLPDTASKTLNCTLKAPTSIENPSFIIQNYDTSYNYVKWGNHYYFINDITFLHNDLCEISCTTDVLATYREQILASTQFVERAANRYNLNLNDTAISQSQHIVYESDPIQADLSNFSYAGCYIVRIVGGAGTESTGISTYALSANQLENLMNFMFNADSFIEFAEQQTLKYLFNPFQYIVSVKWFPINKNAFNVSSASVILGWWDSGLTAPVVENDLGGSFPSWVTLKSMTLPSRYYNDFRDLSSNYTEFNLFLPGVGFINLPPEKLYLYDTFSFKYAADLITGECRVNIYTGDSANTLITSVTGNLGVDIQIGQTMYEGLNPMNLINIGINAGTANVGGFISNIVNSVKPTPSLIGSSGGAGSLVNDLHITLYKYVYGSGGIPESMYGRPLMENVLLSQLSGYVKCGSVSIDIPGLGAEKEEINNMLNNGFYIE